MRGIEIHRDGATEGSHGGLHREMQRVTPPGDDDAEEEPVPDWVVLLGAIVVAVLHWLAHRQ